MPRATAAPFRVERWEHLERPHRDERINKIIWALRDAYKGALRSHGEDFRRTLQHE